MQASVSQYALHMKTCSHNNYMHESHNLYNVSKALYNQGTHCMGIPKMSDGSFVKKFSSFIIH